MTAEQTKLLAEDETLRKRLAKFLALECFRNTGLEILHAGTNQMKCPRCKADIKPLKVFPDLSRLNNAEMKALMIEVVNNTYAWLSILFNEDSEGPAKLGNYIHEYS